MNRASNFLPAEISEHDCGDELHVHRHQNAYVALIVEGGYKEFTASGIWVCEPGDVVIHPPFNIHANRFGDRRTRVLNFHQSFIARDHFDTFGYSVLRSDHADDFLKYWNETESFAALVENAVCVQKQRSSDWVDMMAEDFCQDVTLPVGMAARRYAVSPEHASRTFRARYGMCPSKFRAEQKLQKALQLLLKTPTSIAQIAQISGFSDQAHMARHISAATGMSASILRKHLH